VIIEKLQINWSFWGNSAVVASTFPRIVINGIRAKL